MTKHIVDILIEERATKLVRRPIIWKLIKTCFYPILRYKQAVSTIDAISTMSAFSAFEHLAKTLALRINITGIEHIPKTGCAIMVANHPAGISDGVAVFDALSKHRPDITFFANRDAVRAAPNLSEMLIPVEWVNSQRTPERNKETLKALAKAVRTNRLIVIFPSGRLAKPTWRGLREREWTVTASNLARKYNAPIIPMYLEARNSVFYYFLFLINSELKDMTLFRELVNKTHHSYLMRVGPPFELKKNSHETTKALRTYVTEDLAGKSCSS